jgi:prepilin-type N-terminal cleavage/methylation domain-containing protein
MKKNGFTLAETVITMAVIGVVAAISLPLINSFRIDENKVLFLRAYDAIVEATQMIISNSEMYPPIGEGDQVPQDNGEPEAKKYYDFSECPLLNITHEYILENVKIGNVTKKVTCGGTDLNGMNKFSKLLAYAIGIPGTNIDDPTKITLKNGVVLQLIENAITSDYLSNRFLDDSAGKFMYLTEINMDVNDRVTGKDNKNCSYDKTKCPHPDQFLLYVTADGQVHAIDPMAQYYLKTRSNLRLNKETLDTNKYEDLKSYRDEYLMLERPAEIQ